MVVFVLKAANKWTRCRKLSGMIINSTSSFRCLSTKSNDHSQPSYYHHIGSQPLVYRTIGQQLERAAIQYGEHEAIVSCAQNIRYTFRQVLDMADRIAAGYYKLGLKRGDHIGIWSPNTVEWYIIMMGIARGGFVSVALNPAYQVPEIAYCLKKVKCKALFANETYRNQKYYEMLATILPELNDTNNNNGLNHRLIENSEYPLSRLIIDSENELPGAYKFDELLSIASNEEINEIKNNQELTIPDNPCNIQFTSGTTGQPKAAVLSHFNFVNNGIHISNRNEMSRGKQRICVQVPLFHAYGVVISVMAAMIHGNTLVLPDYGYNAEKSLKAIAKEKCTIIHGTPTMYVDLVAKQKELNYNLDSAEVACTGGATCTPKLFMDIKNVLQLRTVKTVFGMTETTASIYFSLANETDKQVTETVGFLQDHLEAKVVDPNDRIVAMGQPGELCVRGYSTMLGYFDDEAKTKETISNDKWLKTGDQFIMEENGYGRIVGRLKDLIIRGGENIYPKEIEDFYNQHLDIIECHVFGVPDERLGEEVCMHIRTTLKNGKNRCLTREDIKKFAEGRLAYFKIPKYVKVVDNFPKTTSGKVQKFLLRKHFDKKNYIEEL